MLAVPAAAGTAAFSLFVYFENFGDVTNSPGAATGQITGLKSNCEGIPEPTRTYISNAAQYTRVPAAFIAATAKQESGFNKDAQSAYAGGVMQLANQLLPDTYDVLNSRYRTDYKDGFAGFKSGTKIKPTSQKAPTAITGNRKTDIYIAEYNIFLGAKLQRELYDQYKERAKGNDQKLFEYIAAAYNGGPQGLANAKYNYTKMAEETRNYVPKVMANYQNFKSSCQEDLTPNTPSSVTDIVTGTVTNNAAQQVKNRVNTDKPGLWHQLPGQCANTTSALLATVFGGRTGKEGNGLGSYPNQPSTEAPTSADMSQAANELKAGRIPVWHIVGPNQEHWIAVLEVNGNNLTYFEPASGTIETSPTSKTGGNGNNYFGITHQGCFQNDERGYGFTP